MFWQLWQGNTRAARRQSNDAPNKKALGSDQGLNAEQGVMKWNRDVKLIRLQWKSVKQHSDLFLVNGWTPYRKR